MSVLNWLEKWYQSNCGSDWEHVYGVKIATLDNPGWHVRIDLAETPLVGRAFTVVMCDNGDDDWINCRVVDDVFEGGGDTLKLEVILKRFKEWVETTLNE